MRVHRHNDAEARKQCQDRCAAMTHERQRHTNNRKNATHHTDIDEDIDKKRKRNRPHQQASKGILRLNRNNDSTPYQQNIKNQ